VRDQRLQRVTVQPGAGAAPAQVVLAPTAKPDTRARALRRAWIGV
jgi:hypothetical protein